MYKEFVEKLYTYTRFAKLGLKNIQNLLEILGNPQNSFKTIHIAGTNGKGSVAAMITQMLMEEGYRTGLYISPHLVDFRERIQINREWIPEKDLLRIGKELLDIVESGNPASFFEITTAIMFRYFEEKNVDYGVIEVGMGGRLDATNVILPEVSIITHISLDHTKILGDTIEKIASEKAGIIKNKPTVISDYSLYEFFSGICKKRGSKLYSVGKDIKYTKKGEFFDVSGVINLKNLEVSLKGDHQILNASTAILAAYILGISRKSIRKGLKNVRWEGRFEIVSRKPLIVFDGGHNPDGVKTAVNTMKKLSYENIYILFGVLKDKDYRKMIDYLKDLKGSFIFTKPNSDRALDPEELLKYADGTVITDPEEAFRKIKEMAKNEDAILAIGSLYLIGDIKSTLCK